MIKLLTNCIVHYHTKRTPSSLATQFIKPINKDKTTPLHRILLNKYIRYKLMNHLGLILILHHKQSNSTQQKSVNQPRGNHQKLLPFLTKTTKESLRNISQNGVDGGYLSTSSICLKIWLNSFLQPNKWAVSFKAFICWRITQQNTKQRALKEMNYGFIRANIQNEVR